jgi:hypothetical protein
VKIKFKQWLHPQMGIVPVDPKTPLVLEAEIEREWVELSRDEVLDIEETTTHPLAFYRAISDKLKEKNT